MRLRAAPARRLRRPTRRSPAPPVGCCWSRRFRASSPTDRRPRPTQAMRLRPWRRAVRRPWTVQRSRCCQAALRRAPLPGPPLARRTAYPVPAPPPWETPCGARPPADRRTQPMQGPTRCTQQGGDRRGRIESSRRDFCVGRPLSVPWGAGKLLFCSFSRWGPNRNIGQRLAPLQPRGTFVSGAYDGARCTPAIPDLPASASSATSSVW